MNEKTGSRPILPQDYYSAQEVMNLLRIGKRRLYELAGRKDDPLPAIMPKRKSTRQRIWGRFNGISRAACGRYAHGTAGGEMVLYAERLRCCAIRPLRERGKAMLGCRSPHP